MKTITIGRKYGTVTLASKDLPFLLHNKKHIKIFFFSQELYHIYKARVQKFNPVKLE